MPKIPATVAQYHLWLRGQLRFKLHKAQRRIDDAYRRSKGLVFVGNCSRRLGKTYWACCKAVEVALTCKLTFPKIFYASATVTDLKKYVLTSFDMVLADCPEEIRPTWVASEKKFVFPNGAEIYLLGLDKRPDGGRGTHADLYIFEEAGQIEQLEYLYSSVVSPMTITRPGARIIMISTPSPTPAHSFKDFCERAQETNSYIEITIDDNPMLSPQQKIDALAACLTNSERLREYYCQHVIDENLAIIPEWRNDFAVDVVRPEYFNYLHKYVAMDLGTKIDLTAVLYAFYDARRKVLVVEAEDEMTGPAMTSVGLKNIIYEREHKLWPGEKPYKRISDNNNPLLLQDLGLLHDLWFISTGKDNLHAMVDVLRVLVRDGRIEVSKNCPKLIGSIAYGLWNKQRTAFSRSPRYGHFDHLAALIYLVRNVDFVTDPFPELPSYKTNKTHLIHIRDRKERSLSKIKKIFGLE